MNRLLTCTALGFVLSLSPALAEPQNPADQAQTPPAIQDPAQPSEAIPGEPMKPAAPIPDESSQSGDVPGQSSQMAPSAPDESAPPAQSSQAIPAAPDESAPPAQSSQAIPGAPDESAPPAQSSEAPESTMPANPSASADADSASPKFLSKQENTDLLASSLIGQPVYNSQDESVGDINDLVTDQSGKVVAVLVGSGGFLGIGEKDVALGFEDLRFAQDQDGNIKVLANVTKETLASAPDYQTLAEQKITVGENKGDREDRPE
jgi:hypothetical protein